MTSNKTAPNRHGSAVITLPSPTEILITRVFDAPTALIFKAWTTPEVVSTEVYEGFPDAAALNTVALEEVNHVTTMKTLVQHEKPEHRDAHLASGMESGMQVSYNRLEDVVQQLAVPLGHSEGPVLQAPR